jgi:6-phosphogluconolactonase
VLGDQQALAAATADLIAGSLVSAVAARGRALAVLAGGTTPRGVYRELARSRRDRAVDWSRVELFWGDERCVAPTLPESNFGMVQEVLLNRLGDDPPLVHRIRGELPAEEAAERYEKTVLPAAAEPPLFDLVLLGLGADGHTASLFPGRPDLIEERRLVVATRSPLPPFDRVSLTARALSSARRVVFLVSGREKASAVRRVLELADQDLPASWVRPPGGALLWLLDREAAAQLEKKPGGGA